MVSAEGRNQAGFHVLPGVSYLWPLLPCLEAQQQIQTLKWEIAFPYILRTDFLIHLRVPSDTHMENTSQIHTDS